MRNRFFSRVLPIAALGLVVLFKFDNCAPAAKFATSSGSNSGTVKIIGSWSSSPVEFLTASQIVTTNSTTVKGVCVGISDGSTVDWAVTSAQNPNQVLNSGQVQCQNGAFEVAVGNVAFQSCSDQYEVRAASPNDTNDTAVTLLEPDCPSAVQ